MNETVLVCHDRKLVLAVTNVDPAVITTANIQAIIDNTVIWAMAGVTSNCTSLAVVGPGRAQAVVTFTSSQPTILPPVLNLDIVLAKYWTI